MLAFAGGVSLTGLASRLIALAACSRVATPLGGRTLETRAEGAREGFRGTETHAQRDVEHRHARLSAQARGGGLEPASAQVVAQHLAHERVEQAMKMKWREMRYAGERGEIELLIEMAVDVLDHRMHASGVFSLTASGGSQREGQRPR